MSAKFGNPEAGDKTVARIFMEVGSVELGPGDVPLIIRRASDQEIAERLAQVNDKTLALNHRLMGEGPSAKVELVDCTGRSHFIQKPVTPEQVQALSETVSTHLKNLVHTIPRNPYTLRLILEKQD